MSKKSIFTSVLTKDFLVQKYVIEKRGTREIGREIGASDMTVASFLRLYGIEVRKRGHVPEDLTDSQFGNFYVVENIGRHSYKSRNTRYKCRCVCDNIIILTGYNLKNEITKSCGCKKPKGNDCSAWTGGKYISGSWISNFKSNAKNRRYIVGEDITIEFLEKLLEKQEFRCAISGKSLRYFKDASLDRIDNSGHYTRGNIQWLHKKINMMKHTLLQSNFIELCREVAKHNDYDG